MREETLTDVPWITVAGFGAHIKSTPKSLIVQKNGSKEEYPIKGIEHLLIIGGHTLHTATIMHLVDAGAAITLFEPDGRPVGSIRPYRTQQDNRVREIHALTPKHGYAVAIAKASIRSRILAVHQLEEALGREILYQGELEILDKARDELEYLIKLEEVRRLHQLTEDMYYEIIARCVSGDLNFRRRTTRPYRDPVNAMLSFGYAMLYGNCLVSILGAGLDPDEGMLHRGRGSLVRDLIEAWKSRLIDLPVVEYCRETGILTGEYEVSDTRCILSDRLMRKMIAIFHSLIDRAAMDTLVYSFRESLEKPGNFDLNYEFSCSLAECTNPDPPVS